MPSARKRMRSLYERAHVTRRASDPAPFRAVPAFAPACGFRLCFCTKKIQNRPEYQMLPYSHADVRQTLKFLCKMAKIIYFAILLLYNMNKLRPACRFSRRKQLTPCGRELSQRDPTAEKGKNNRFSVHRHFSGKWFLVRKKVCSSVL